MDKITLCIISLSVTVIYLTFITLKYGVQKSISASVYCLPKIQQPLFTLWTWGTAIPMILTGGGLIFFAGASLAFVGVASLYRDDKLTSKVHFFAAPVCIILGYAHLFFVLHHYDITLISIVILIGIYYLLKKNPIWWIEIWAYLSIIFGIMI